MGDRPTGTNMHSAKLKVNELLAKWLSSQVGNAAVRAIVDETLTEARRTEMGSGQPSTATHHIDTNDALSASLESALRVDPASNLQHSNRSGGSPQPTSPGRGAGNHRHGIRPGEAYAADRGGGGGGSPVNQQATGLSGSNGQGGAGTSASTSTVHTPNSASASRPFLGVDEIDMTNRAMSPASPVSPNAAMAKLHSSSSSSGGTGGTGHGHHVVDPTLPLAAPPSPVQRERSPVNDAHHHQTSPHHSHSGYEKSHSNPGFGRNQSTSSMGSVSGSFAPKRRTASYQDIPRFFFPKGNTAAADPDEKVDEIAALRTMFSTKSSARTSASSLNSRVQAVDIDSSKGVKRAEFAEVCVQVFGLPQWLRNLLFRKILSHAQLPDNGQTTVLRFAEIEKYYNAVGSLPRHRRLFEVMRSADAFAVPPSQANAKRWPLPSSVNNQTEFLSMEELAATVRHLVDCHQGLSFLTQAEFQDVYCKTVAYRILYHNERSRTRYISWHEFERSDVPHLMIQLDEIQDINTVLRYFSYEHFYVLYCRFWELDTDKNHLINENDLLNYSGSAISPKAIERVVSGAGRKLTSGRPKVLNFEDFVYFCLSEEDKNTLPAKRYWFRVLDIDGDGVISGHEMAEFWEEQWPRFQNCEDSLMYEDMLCQMLDMVVPDLPNRQGIRLEDLHDCETAEHFFNLFTNATKFMLFEHREPFVEHNARNNPEKTAWEKFARAEYDRMAAEAAQ